jgi:probable phosphoglycerate mutase
VRTVYVVVHPEAAHHAEGLVGGWYDSQLTPAGARAAVLIAEALRARIPAAAEAELYSSDLQRARHAAIVVGDRLRVRRSLTGACARSPTERPAAGRRRGWTSGSSRRLRPGTGWATMKAYDYFHNRQVVSLGDTRHLGP